MDGSLYEAEGLGQLNNTNYYSPIVAPDWDNNMKDIDEILVKMLQHDFIKSKKLEYMHAITPIKPRPFYLLHKVDKDKAKWAHEVARHT